MHPDSARRPTSRTVLLSSLSLILLVACLLSLLTGRGTGLTWPDWDWQTQLILWEIRLPRTLLAAVSGAVLGLAGAVLQGWLRNPLADPGILGVSSTSALVAVAAMYFGLGTLAWSIPLAGIVGAWSGFQILLMLTGKESGILLIILAGAAINAFCSAMTALLLNLAPNPFAMQDMMFWMMGSFENRTLDHVALVSAPVILGEYCFCVPDEPWICLPWDMTPPVLWVYRPTGFTGKLASGVRSRWVPAFRLPA